MTKKFINLVIKIENSETGSINIKDMTIPVKISLLLTVLSTIKTWFVIRYFSLGKLFLWLHKANFEIWYTHYTSPKDHKIKYAHTR